MSNPADKIFDHKWLDPNCIDKGCQSLMFEERIRKLTDVALSAMALKMNIDHGFVPPPLHALNRDLSAALNAIHPYAPAPEPRPPAWGQVLDVLEAQHRAIDELFARIGLADRSFFPSQSGQPWEAIKSGKALIDQLKGLPVQKETP